MLRCALVVGIAGCLCAQEPVPTPPAPVQVPVAAPTPRAQAEQFVRELAEPGKQNAAVAGLVALGDAAVPALHKALLDRRSEVLQWALFACSGLSVNCASLRAPIERLRTSSDLGVALMAARAWPVAEGKSGLLLTLGVGEILLVGVDAETALGELGQSFHTELLPSGNLLTVSHNTGRAREVDAEGKEVWIANGLQSLVDCKRLPDGNTLLCSYNNRRVVELKPNGDVAWSIETKGCPFEADRLANGNTLITQFNDGGVIEVDRAGKTVWSFDGSQLTSASRQLDGNTLVTDMDSSRIVLIAPNGKELRGWDCASPMHAELLPNGCLAVNRRTGACVLDPDGKEVWSFARGAILGMQVLGAGPFRPGEVATKTPPK